MLNGILVRDSIPKFHKEIALKYGRFIRDRYTILDLAGDSNQLNKLINV